MRDNPYEINIKAAGTAMRFMTAYLAVKDGEEHVLTGTERMKHRPISVLVDALRFLGADIQYVGEEDCWKCQATSVRNISQPC